MHNLPEKIGVTANLTINYRAPTRADQVHILFISKCLDPKLIRLFALVHRV
jgi:hypothetical protein